MKAFIIEYKNIGIKDSILFDYLRSVFECTADFNTADVIITDLYSVSNALKVKEQSGLPIVLIFFKSQQDKLFNLDTLCIDQLICVRDTPMAYNVPQLYPYEEILFPIQILNNDYEKSLQKGGNILVSLSDSLINGIQLYEIIRLLNRMAHYNITILHTDVNIECICNNHISVTNQFDKIDYLVESSSCVVGSGIASILALMHQKHLIIIGDTGYGGTPTQNNLLNHRKNYFQGTIGNSLGSPIPIYLLYEDIEKIPNGEKQNIVLEELNKNLENDKQQILDIIHRVINSRKSQEYKLNTSLDFRNVEDFGIIIQRYTNQILAELDKDCSTALKWIVDGQSINKIDPAAIKLLIENNIIESK